MLREFDGTVLFVSHDRFFIDRVATRVWVIDDGVVCPYLGNYTDVQRKTSKKPEPQKPPAASLPEATKPAPEPRRRQSGEGAAQKSLTQVEREIAKLEGRLNELSDALAIASIDADVAAVERLGAEYSRLQDELEGAYARWEEVSSQFELVAGRA